VKGKKNRLRRKKMMMVKVTAIMWKTTKKRSTW
jgi:hypothetical protein